jgi:signal peptidase II
MSRARAWVSATLVAVLVVAADQITKSLVEANITVGERVDVLGPIQLTNVGNTGIAFGLAGGGGTVLVALALLTLVLVIGFFARDPGRRGIWLAIGLLVGGAAGNLIDRIAHEAVTDFIKIGPWPTFNVADIAITLGVVLLAWALIREPR